MSKYEIRNKFSQIRWSKEICFEKFGVNDENVICLWVADSDIALYDEINEYILERAKYPFYGYHFIDETFKRDFINFHKKYRNQNINFNEVFFTSGTVFSFSMLIQTFTQENENVLFNIPIYNPLVNSVIGLKRNAVLLKYKNIKNKFYFDYDELEKVILEKSIKLFTLVSPLNPSGRVWTYDELLKIVEICKKHNLLIISDEIHCDIIFKNSKFVSMLEFYKIYNKIVVISSVNKTFNIAGMQTGWGICKDEKIYKKIKSKLDNNHISQTPNIFAQVAMQGCFEKGERYLKDSIQLFESNIKYVKEYFQNNCSALEIFDMEATFLPYICFEKTNISFEKMKELLWKEAKVLVQFNDDFVDDLNHCFRMNVATDIKVIQDACERIAKVVNKNLN